MKIKDYPEREYLDDGTEVYCSGAYLIWRDGKFRLHNVGWDDEIWCNGWLVYFDEDGRPYVDAEDSNG